MTSQMPEEKDVTQDWEKAKTDTQERQTSEDDEETMDWEQRKPAPKGDS